MQTAKAKDGLTNRFLSLFGLVERKAASLAAPDAALLELFSATPSASGISITPRVAMSCAPVRCAVQAISEAVGQLPVLLYRRLPEGGKERDPQHPAYALLHDQANEWTSASDFREQLTRDALLNGNGFAFINRVDGKPVELLRLDPASMSVSYETLTGEPTYTLTDEDGAKRTYPREDILHIRAPSLDGVAGIAPIHSCREAIGLSLIMEQHCARLFSNSARPSGLISFKEKMDANSLKDAMTIWRSAMSGENTGKTGVLDRGATWSQITLSPVDAQFIELRQFQILEIARAFRIPPIFLMEYGRATWSNSAEMGQQFLTYCLEPWLKRWEGEIRLKLISPENRETCFAEFLTDALLRSDVEKRGTYYQTLRVNGVLSANEIRALENYPPREGGDTYENPNTTSGAQANA